MAKPKVWYKHLKAGDKIVVKLLPGHTWYNEQKGKELTATIKHVHVDGSINCCSDQSLATTIPHYTLNIGWEGTNWAESYPANILRKVKQPGKIDEDDGQDGSKYEGCD